jgi:hypothetical protein
VLTGHSLSVAGKRCDKPDGQKESFESRSFPLDPVKSAHVAPEGTLESEALSLGLSFHVAPSSPHLQELGTCSAVSETSSCHV